MLGRVEVRQGVEGLQHQPLGSDAEFGHRGVADAHVEGDGHLRRGGEHRAHGGGDRTAAGDQQHVLARMVAPHVVQHGTHAVRESRPARHARRADGAAHPLRERIAQQAEVLAVELGRVCGRQGLGMDGRDQGGAVVLVERGQRLQRLGRGLQTLGDAGQRLCMPPQGARIDGVEAHAALAPVGAQPCCLLMAAGAELVVVLGAEGGLRMAHEVEGSHVWNSPPRCAPPFVSLATACSPGPALLRGRWSTSGWRVA